MSCSPFLSKYGQNALSWSPSGLISLTPSLGSSWHSLHFTYLIIFTCSPVFWLDYKCYRSVEGLPERHCGSRRERERLRELVIGAETLLRWVWYSSSSLHCVTLINYLLRCKSFHDWENRDKDREEHFIRLFLRTKWVDTPCSEEGLVGSEHPLGTSITHFSLLWKRFSCLRFLGCDRALVGSLDGCCLHLRDGKLGDYLHSVGVVPQLKLYPSAFFF